MPVFEGETKSLWAMSCASLTFVSCIYGFLLNPINGSTDPVIHDDNFRIQQSGARIDGVFFAICDVDEAIRYLETEFKWRFVKYRNLHNKFFCAQYTLAVCRQHLGDLKKTEYV